MENIKEYIKRIKTLNDLFSDDLEFSKALHRQNWIIPAIIENSSDGSIKTVAEQLNSLLESADASAKEIRRISIRLLQELKKYKSTPGKETRQEIFTLAWWSSIAALISTLAAIFIGKKGIIEIIESLNVKSQGSRAETVTEQISILSSAMSPSIITSFEAVIAVIHVCLIVLFIFLQYTEFGKPAADRMPTEEFAKKTFKQFSWGWLFIWITWLLLYIWLSYCWGYTNWPETQSSLVWSVADILNIFNSFSFFFCFLVFDMRSVVRSESGKTDEIKPFWRKAILILTIGIVFAVLSVLGRFHFYGLDSSGPFLSTCYTGLAMAYFFGRLDSFSLALPRYMLVPLYLYVIIQTKWVSFVGTSADPLEPVLFLGLALILKALLFILVTHWIREGNISRYLDTEGRALDEKNSQQQ